MIIGICGAIGSGKDTVAQYICDSREYVRVSMAAALKDAAAVVFGWDRNMLEGLTPEHRAQREQPDTFWAEKLGIPGFSPRMALQIIGTDLFRDHFHPEIWVFAAERKIMQATNVVISDIRFPNEIEMIRRRGGDIWHIRRGPDPSWWQCAKDDLAGKAIPPNTMALKYPNVHFSEWAWVNTKFDIILKNDSDLMSLYNDVEWTIREQECLRKSNHFY